MKEMKEMTEFERVWSELTPLEQGIALVALLDMTYRQAKELYGESGLRLRRKIAEKLGQTVSEE
jgi:hypothetical protein